MNPAPRPVTRRPAALGPHELLVDLAAVPLDRDGSRTVVRVPLEDDVTFDVALRADGLLELDRDLDPPLSPTEALDLAYALLALVREHDRLELAQRLSAAGQAATRAGATAEPEADL